MVEIAAVTPSIVIGDPFSRVNVPSPVPQLQVPCVTAGSQQNFSPPQGVSEPLLSSTGSSTGKELAMNNGSLF